MKYRIYILTLVVFIFLFTGCQTESNKTMVSDQEVGNEDTAKSTARQQFIYSELEEIGVLYRDIYEEAKKNNLLDAIETRQKIADRLGEAGYVVCDTENRINMENYGQAQEFCELAALGKSAEITILLVTNNGGLARYDLKAENTQLEVETSSLQWKEAEIETGYYQAFTAHTWSYTEKGYLFIEQYRPAGYDGASGLSAFRIKPLEQELRNLNEKYVRPIGYECNKLLITDWDETDCGELDFYDLYEVLYHLKYGFYVPYESGVGGREYEIAGEDFEKVIQTYFNIESSVLQNCTVYNPENQSYRYRPRGFHDAQMPYVPYPEVVGYEEMEDGNIKLIIEAVWVEEKEDRALKSELIVRPLDDVKFQYVSNHVISSENSVAPVWYVPRLSDAEWTELYENIPEEDIFEKGYDLPIKDEVRETARADCEKIMESIREIYISAEKGETVNTIISKETACEMMSVIKQTGCPVTFTDSYFDMENHEEMEAFLKKAENGEPGEIVVYDIIESGGITRKHFQFDGNQMYELCSTATWSGKSEPVISTSYARIKEWKYTDKGWFGYKLCVPEYPEVTEVMDGSCLIRVKPMSEENRAMTEKCVAELGYRGNNLLCTNWSAENIEDLDYNGLFEYLYKMEYGQIFSTADYPDGIPKEEFEAMLMKYLPVTAEQIRQYAVFDEENQTYRWVRLGCGNYAPTFFGTSVPEVTKITENQDGTITLTVDAVCEMLICEDALITHELRVRFLEDGSFQYLGNEILNNGVKDIPIYQYRFGRE